MENIYVARISFGYGDNHESHNIFVGPEKWRAIDTIKAYEFPDPYNNYGYLEIWSAGRCVKEELIRE